MPCKNIVQFSSAGSGKTTEIVNEVITDTTSKILIVTYTRENCANIENRIKQENGFIPLNVKILSWANFIMRDCVRPFHQNKCVRNIENFIFDIPRDKQGKPINLNYKTEDLRRYLSSNMWIYYDYATDFSIQCNKDNCIINRLEKVYNKIYIDEVQGLAGYDLDFLELLLKSNITVKMYGDIRQATYRTQNVSKNSKYRGIAIKTKFEERAKSTKKREAIVTIEEKNISIRCCESICKVADLIFPKLPRTTSQAENVPTRNGVWFVNDDNIKQLFNSFNNNQITILRWNKGTKLESIVGYTYYNFGECKGCTFDNVLIICTPKFLEFVKTVTIPNEDEVKTKLYIAITRVRHNVFFYSDKKVENIRLNDCKIWDNQKDGS